MSPRKNKSRQSFFDEEVIQHHLGLVEFNRKIWPLLRPHRWTLSLLLLMVIAFVLTGRLLPLVFGYAIDEGIKKNLMPVVIQAALAYLLLELIRSGLQFAQSYGFQKMGNRVLFELREKTISHVQSLPLTYFDKNPAGRTVTRITNDVTAIGELFSFGFTAIFVNTLEMLGIGITLFIISPRLALATLAVSPILTLICIRLSREIRFIFKEAKRRLATINAFTAESLYGIKILQLFYKTKERQAEFNHYSEEYKDLNLKTVDLFALLWPIIEFFHVTTIGTALFLGGLYQTELHLSIGTFSAFLLLVQGFFQPLRTILERYAQFQNSLASADRIFSLLEETPEPLSGTGLTHLDGSLRKIELIQVSHRYGADNPWALKDLNLEIHAGESLALVGRTGSGKSTLISILQGLYLNTLGDILIDGQPLSSLAIREWRQRVGVVLQDNFIFKGTIASNIGLNNPQISSEKIMKAIQVSGYERILKLRQGGLDTLVEERGANLSAGERQLLAFARIIAFDPEILILDEATANIDSISESLIQEATRQILRQRTCVIIAHRLSTILDCDRIAVLDNGQLVELGSHHHLMEKKGKYFDLFTAQFRSTSLPSANSPPAF